MYKYFLRALLVITLTGTAGIARAQYYSLGTNALLLATGTVNAGFEFTLDKKNSVDISLYYNPLNKGVLPASLLMVQPSYRRWLYECFAGHFICVHPTWGRYGKHNKTSRAKGWLAGAGISYGYVWVINNRFNVGLQVGGGIFYMNEKQSPHPIPEYGPAHRLRHKKLMILPSKLELSLSRLF